MISWRPQQARHEIILLPSSSDYGAALGSTLRKTRKFATKIPTEICEFQETFHIDNCEISYLRDTRFRRLSLSVGAGGVSVRVPCGCGEGEVARFLERHGAWIRRKLAEYRGSRISLSPILAGGTVMVPFRGEMVELRLEKGTGFSHSVAADGGRIAIFKSGLDRLDAREQERLMASMLASWYFRRSAELIRQIWLRLEPAAPGGSVSLWLKDLRTSWGTCSKRNRRISLNWRLVMAPEKVCEYVVAHELSHLRRADHGSEFWKQVADLVPECREHRKWLNANGLRLMNFLGEIRPKWTRIV